MVGTVEAWVSSSAAATSSSCLGTSSSAILSYLVGKVMWAPEKGELEQVKQFLVERPNHAQSYCYNGTPATDFAITDPNYPVRVLTLTQGQCYCWLLWCEIEGLIRKSAESRRSLTIAQLRGVPPQP